MEQSSNILNKIDVPTNKLRVDVIRELLILMKQNSKSPSSQEFWNEVSEKIWVHLMNGFEELDDQLLCATCFYSMIMLTDKQDHYLDKLLHIIGPCRDSFSQHFHKHESEVLPLRGELTMDIGNKHSVYIVQVVSLMYGVFQSSFVTQKTYHNIQKVADVIKDTFDLLLLMGYEYSQYTFLAFKTMKSFQKVCGGPLEKYIFNVENQIKLIDLVNNNWENPITGVRDLNRSIFQTVLSTLDEETYNKCIYEIDRMYWNKAKYLMLTHVIENSKENLALFIKMKWMDGLIYSLHKPGLVSAGADMYYATLKKIYTQNDWCQLYLTHVIDILVSHNIKAIENFNNYWCLTTLKKFRETAFILIDELEKHKYSEELLYSKLYIMKQANKLGIIKNLLKVDTSIQKAVLTGVSHYNSNIRICAFDILCVSQGKFIPSPKEYDLILDYFFNNVNSDSTVLRLSMLGCFNSFLSQLHTNFINVIMKNQNAEDVDNLINFCKQLQYFLIHNLNIQGNYQRKISSVKLCNIILSNFSEITRKKKDQTRQANVTLKEFLKERALWLLSTEDFILKLISLLSDPSEDVRENVINILLNHYTDELQNETLLTYIIDNAKKNITSKFFYDISCSQCMFKLISNLLLKKNNSIKIEYSTVEDIFEFALNELMSQHKKPINVMDSIEEGKQLHSYINILLVVLEECVTNTSKINIHSKMSELLEALENISNQFAWDEGCSDFSKMNEMVQNIIDDSHFRNVDEPKHTKISGMQQIVLNCMWLNVKASCDLASVLVQYNYNSVALCEQCLNIITRVLETSRHKGAIEAAGAALGRAIQYLTALPKTKDPEHKLSQSVIENSDVSILPYILLKRKLNELILETNKMSSITRRGAGLSIMVHRIVSSDMQKGKPLFHCFMQTLLQICNRKDHSIENHHIGMDENMENQLDVPKAIYIHFLTRIVTDSCLATDMMYYSVELAELAFGNLISPDWQIRNAALQLYGALVPRLIGQKKASGTDEETIATIACDELRTHFPKLWVYITKQLESNYNKDIQAHSNLVPILNMLGNSAKRYTILLDYSHHDLVYEKLFYDLICLLNSPIHTVRRLTARTIFNLYQFEYITNGILRKEIVSENLLNGFLLLLSLFLNYYKDPKHDSSFKYLKTKFNDIFRTKRSYINKKLFEDIFGNDGLLDMKCIENTLVEIRSNVSPGIHNWAQARLSKYIQECSWNNIPRLINILLQDNDYEKYLEYIFLKIRTQPEVSPDILRKLADILLTFENRFRSCIIWKIVYEISLQTDLCINTEDLMNMLKDNLSYNIRYMLPLMARNVAKVHDEHKATLLGIINNFSDFESADFDDRYIAAVANNELACNFDKLCDKLKVISLKCNILLLQDEDEDIRNLTVKFCSVLLKDKNVLQPYIYLNKTLDRKLLNTIFTKPDISLQELSAKLNAVITNVLKCNCNKDKYNPFANDSKNIYFESDVLKLLVDNLNIDI